MARTRIRLVAGLATAAALAAPTTASAVTTDCSGLQAALNNNANSVVTLAEGSTCNNHFDLPSRSITLEGGGSGATLSGASKGNFQILSGHDVSSTTIRNLTFLEGESPDNGGAIRLTGDSPVSIEDNTFLGNFANEDGGAISIDSQDSPPIETLARGDATAVFLHGNTFGGTEEGDANNADNRGGAVYINEPFRPVVIDEGNSFVDNEAEGAGGGLYVDSAVDFVLIDNLFESNDAGGDGGGAAAHVCDVAEVTDNDFVDNEAAAVDTGIEGGGLALYRDACRDERQPARGGEAGPDLTQSGNVFESNSIRGSFSFGNGGGEFAAGFIAESTNDSFVGNEIVGTQQAFGGGLAYYGSGSQPLAARNLVAAGNVVSATEQTPPSRGILVQGTGGGLLLVGNGNAEFRVEDSTIEGNVAPQGSGIAELAFFGGGLAGRGATQSNTLVLQNSIVFGNDGASDSAQSAIDGEIAGFPQREVSFSDVCNDGAAHAGEGNLCVDPKLTAPDTDGNVDQLAGGPTIDKGDSSLVDADLTTDYAGDARVLGAKVDMGADEYKPKTTTPPVTEQPPAAAPPAQAVQGAQQRSCKSKRVFRIRIRVPKGKKALSAVVRVNGKKVKVVRGKRLRAPVRLRGLPKGKFKVRITIRLANGRKISGVRTYHTCIPRLPGDGPPKV